MLGKKEKRRNKDRQKQYNDYINRNFLPAPDKKVIQKFQKTLAKVNRTQTYKMKIQKKQIENKNKGTSFLQESAKFGRDLMEKFGYTRNYGFLPEKKGGVSTSMLWKYKKLEKENQEEDNKPKKRRKTFKYTFIKNGRRKDFESEDEKPSKKKRKSKKGGNNSENEHSEEESNEESEHEKSQDSDKSQKSERSAIERSNSSAENNRPRLQLGETQEVPWPEDINGFYETQNFLKELQQRDRFIKNDEGQPGLAVSRFKSEEGRRFKTKSDFIVDTIRTKINFIKRCCQ